MVNLAIEIMQVKDNKSINGFDKLFQEIAFSFLMPKGNTREGGNGRDLTCVGLLPVPLADQVLRNDKLSAIDFFPYVSLQKIITNSNSWWQKSFP